MIRNVLEAPIGHGGHCRIRQAVRPSRGLARLQPHERDAKILRRTDLPQRRGGDGDTPRTVLSVGLHRDGMLLGYRLSQCSPHRGPQWNANHFEEILGDLPGWVLEERSSVAVEVHDALVRIHDGSRGTELRQQGRLDEQGARGSRAHGRPEARDRPQLGRARGKQRHSRCVRLARRTSPEDAPALADNFEETFRVAERLGISEQQVPAVTECEMQQGQPATLRLRLQIDEEISTRNDIDARERRIAQQVLRSEHDLLPQGRLHPISVIVFVEELCEALGGQIAFDAGRIDSGTGEGEGLIRRVGSEHLDLELLAGPRGFLGNENRQGVRLLAAGARRDPGADRIPLRPLLYERPYDRFAQRLPGFWIAKEAGYIDHQVVGKRGRFRSLLPDVRGILVELSDSEQPHAPLDPPHHGSGLVRCEVMSGAGPDCGHDLLQVLAVPLELLGRASPACRIEVQLRMLDISQHRGGDFLYAQDLVGISRVDQALRHAREIRGFRILRDAQPTGGLDGLRSCGSIGAGAGEHDGNCVLLLLPRERPEEIVDGTAVAVFLDRLSEMECALLDGHGASGPNYIDVIRLHGEPVFDLAYRHPRATAQDFGHQTLVLRREVLDHDIGNTAVRWSRREERTKGFDSSGRRADAYDSELELRPRGEINRRRRLIG